MYKTFDNNDIKKILMSAYFTIRTNRKSQDDVLRGFLLALVAIGITVGIRPNEIISKNDLNFLSSTVYE
jgi:hypothetical protein